MPKKSGNMQRICGNCRYHNTYEYPERVFCFAKFSDREDPVVSIYDHCEDWESKLQECFCLEDAQKKHRKRTR